MNCVLHEKDLKIFGQNIVTFVGFASDCLPLEVAGIVCLSWWHLRRAQVDIEVWSPSLQSVSATMMFLNVPTCLHADETERIVSQKRIWQRFSHSHLFANTLQSVCRTSNGKWEQLLKDQSGFCKITKNHIGFCPPFSKPCHNVNLYMRLDNNNDTLL